jgi:hypothetical protein
VSYRLLCAFEYRWGREAKPTRSEKVEIGLMFDFRDGKNPQCIADFGELSRVADTSAVLPVTKIEEQPKIYFRSREGFCLASLLVPVAEVLLKLIARKNNRLLGKTIDC